MLRLALYLIAAVAAVAYFGTSEETKVYTPKMSAAISRLPLMVKVTLGVYPSNPPAILGFTNLPTGMVVTALITGDVPRECYPRCGFYLLPAVVKNGAFILKFQEMERIAASTYSIRLMAFPVNQSESVKYVIGPNGENLRGPTVIPISETNRSIGVYIKQNQHMLVTEDSAQVID